MTNHLHALCSRRADYRAAFHGKPQPEKRKAPCRHTGELVRLETCELGCAKGTKIKVVRCLNSEIGGEVSVVPYKQGQTEGTCKGCDFYETAT